MSAETKRNILATTVSEFSDDDCSSMAAALAYYTAFSLPPLLLIVITVSGWIWDADAVKGELRGQIAGAVGDGGWEQIDKMMEASAKHDRSIVATLVAVAALLFGATGVVVQLQTALNRAWEVETDPRQGVIKTFATKRILSFAMILGIAFLLLVSLVLTAALNALSNGIIGFLPDNLGQWFLRAVHTAVSFLVILLLFAAMFKWLPDVRIRWRDVWVGAAVTALLFTLGKFLLGYYFSRQAGESQDDGAYGPATSFALILLWVYYSGLIFFLGAEFTQVLARRRGTHLEPSRGAVRVIRRTERVPA
jgi:membrane protein